MYIDRFDDIVNEYDNTYHRTNNMKPVDIKLTSYIDFSLENNSTILNLKLSLTMNGRFLNLKIKI